MRDTDVTDVELQRAKDQIIKSFPARFATRANVAAQLAELAVFGLPDSKSPNTRQDSCRDQGRCPSRGAQVPRSGPPHDRRGGRQEDPRRAARQARARRGA